MIDIDELSNCLVGETLNLYEHVNEGNAPHLRALIENSAWHKLQSRINETRTFDQAYSEATKSVLCELAIVEQLKVNGHDTFWLSENDVNKSPVDIIVDRANFDVKSGKAGGTITITERELTSLRQNNLIYHIRCDWLEEGKAVVKSVYLANRQSWKPGRENHLYDAHELWKRTYWIAQHWIVN